MSVELKLQRFTKTYPLETCNFRKECVPNLIYDEVIVNGLITKELYYSDTDKQDLVIEVIVTYTYGLDTLIERMDYKINYISEDNEVGMIIPKVKILTNRQKLNMLKKRRRTISEEAQANVIGLLKETYPNHSIQQILSIGGAFLIKNKTALEIFESAGSLQIVSDFGTATEEWLDSTPSILGGSVTIRQYLIGVFSA